MKRQQNLNSIVIRFCGPHRGEFLVQVQDSSGLHDRLLAKQELKTLLILSRAFLYEKTQIVDLMHFAECAPKNSVQKRVSQLRKALEDTERELVVNDGETLYRLNVRSIEDGDGFDLCKGFFGPDINAIIEDIIKALIERVRAMTEMSKSSPEVPIQNALDLPPDSRCSNRVSGVWLCRMVGDF